MQAKDKDLAQTQQLAKIDVPKKKSDEYLQTASKLPRKKRNYIV